jgi:hypothetical protein
MGLNPEWTQPRMGLNPEWDCTPNGTQPRMGLNPDWTQPRLGLTPNGLNPDWDSTPTETELRMGLNLEFLSTSNMVYNVYIYQKDGFKKREHWSVYFSQKRLSEPQHIHNFSSMLKKLETIKMIFTAVEILPFEVDRNLRG